MPHVLIATELYFKNEKLAHTFALCIRSYQEAGLQPQCASLALPCSYLRIEFCLVT